MRPLPLLGVLTLAAACAAPAPLLVGGCKVEPSTSCANANLSGQDLARRNLAGANLRGANLARTNFDGANLSNADFSGANLQGAYLASANVQGAKFDGANLSGAQWLERRDGYGTVIPRTCAAGSVGTCKF